MQKDEYPFKDLEKAIYAKKRITRKQKGSSHDVYYCPVCGMYHVGPRYPKWKLERILNKEVVNLGE